ncbi:hypothetical protein [Rhizobium sp. TRM95796]|uniref:hypothetical protein n=1 Tax=Rhizobium sp. TRM95796 TaxID=2979862 RepID=UPI0021E887C9|nr:hypothetical protein [Rhizobium sp. TRM95796]MCV3765153.1 hypothetical protein [Rhizobium sp. TRM95796]
MTNEKSKTPRRRRRNCHDRLRAMMLEARRRRRANPAESVAVQLLALFTILLGRMPVVPSVVTPTPYTSPPLSPGEAYRRDIGRRLGIPPRYVGVVLAQGIVPYSVLFDHVRRGGKSRDDAMKVLRQRAPEPCRDWLDHVEQWGLWSSLLLCHVRSGLDEDTDVRLLRSTLAWLDVETPDDGVPGPAGAGAPATPGLGPDIPDPDEDPKPPKP